jgi:hypothetical protein
MTGHDVLAKIETRLLAASFEVLGAQNALAAKPDDDELGLQLVELHLKADNLEAAWAIVNDITARGT